MEQIDESCGAWMLQSISYNPSFGPSSKNILRKTKQPDSVACQQIIFFGTYGASQIVMLYHCHALKILGRRFGPSSTARCRTFEGRALRRTATDVKDCQN
jgi:hypothetical protein